jgi:hypothetical protein
MRKAERPILVSTLAILQIIVGGLLISWGMLSLASSLAGESSATVTIRVNGQPTTRVYDTWEEMEKQAPGYRKVIVAGRLVDLFLEITIIAGGIGLLLLRRWSWWLTLAWALLQIGYQIVTLVYIWVVAWPAVQRMSHAVPHDDMGVCGTLSNGNTFYHLGWAIFSFLFLGYPLLILLLLVLPPVWRTFSNKSVPDQEVEEYRRGNRPRRAVHLNG